MRRKKQMQPQQKGPEDQKPGGSNMLNLPKIPSWLWLVVLLGIIVWSMFAFRPNSQPEVTIPYSTFISQVKQGNVKSVTISGTSITGTFVKPLTWPQPTSEAAATPPSVPTPQASPTTTPTYTEFQTNYSETVGDPKLVSMLQANNVQVSATAASSPILSMVLTYGLPVLLLVGLMWFMGRQTSPRGGQSGGIFGFGKTKARRYEGNRTGVSFDDVAGEDEAKTELEEVVDFLKHPMKYHQIGARIPRGVLLVGPPGTGKTLLARAVAGEANVPFFSLSASEFVEMFVGVGASRVRDLFEQAKATAPAIVFIDELDAVGRRRGAGLGNVNDEREQTLNQLLVEMDGFDERHEVIVLAATNRSDVLDPAILRPGRFDRQVTVGLPDRKGREGILRIHTRHLQLGPKVDLDLIARSTTGFSGADLANLCNEAALFTARANRKQVTMTDFEEAADKIMLGGVRSLLLDEDARRVIAYHEGGHALVAWLTPGADPVRKVTIIPRGQALGVTEQVPSEDRYNYTKEYLLARLSVMLGGRTSEEVALGEITTGAESDLIQATRLARRMVTRWGMGSLGLITFQADERQPFLGYELSQGRDYSQEMGALIDANIERLLDDRHEYAHQLLTEHREDLDRLATALLEEETLDQDAITELLGPRAEPVAGIEQPEPAPVALAPAT
jgi:cell division protease FtsH